MDNFSEIIEEIDVRIADRIHTNRQSSTLSVYHDPSCVIRHVLKSDIALLKFYNAVKTTCVGRWLKSPKRLGTKGKHLAREIFFPDFLIEKFFGPRCPIVFKSKAYAAYKEISLIIS